MVTIADAAPVARSLARRFQPRAILLYGSVARDREGNDLDLLIVIEDKDNDAARRMTVRITRALKPFSRHFAIDPFVVSSDAVRKYAEAGSPFLHHILSEGKALYMSHAMEEWTTQAKSEAAMARYLLKGSFYRGACYHAQQAIEKWMKARLLRRGWMLEKTHNIQRLTTLSHEHGLRYRLSDEDIAFLDSIYRGRYPAEAGLLPFGEPEEKDANRAVALAQRILRSRAGTRT